MSAVPTSTTIGEVEQAELPEELQAPAPSPAVAPPPGNPRFPLFDGMRGIAVLGILAFHVFTLTGRIGIGFPGKAAEVAGGEAVIVFFAISGFLLYRPYVAARARGRPVPSTRRYARRRALRILPAYWTALTVLAIFPGVVGVFSGDFWRYYGYLQLYSTSNRGHGIPVAWTLCVEVTFYVLLPIWAFAVRRIPTRSDADGLLRAELAPLAAVAACGFAVQIAVAQRSIPYVLGVTLVGQCSWIIIGMALAVASVAAQHDPRRMRPLRTAARWPELCWGVGAAAFLGLMALVPSGGLFGLLGAIVRPQSLSGVVAKTALEGILVAALLLPAIFDGERPGLPRRVLAFGPIAWLGVISYSFYLYHLTIAELLASDKSNAFSAHGLNLIAHLGSASHSAVLYVLTLAATGTVAAVSYRLVELPFLRRKESNRTR